MTSPKLQVGNVAILELTDEDIDTVLLPHAHPDHVGQNLTPAGTPTFPRARYLLHQADWDALPQLQARTPAPFIDEALTPCPVRHR